MMLRTKTEQMRERLLLVNNFVVQVYSYFEMPLLKEIHVGPQLRFSPHLTYTERLISSRQVTFSAHSGFYQLELPILVSIFLCFACNKVITDHCYEAFR